MDLRGVGVGVGCRRLVGGVGLTVRLCAGWIVGRGVAVRRRGLCGVVSVDGSAVGPSAGLAVRLVATPVAGMVGIRRGATSE